MSNPLDALKGGGDDVEIPDPDELIPLMNLQMEANTMDQFTPWGSLTYDIAYNEPLSFDDWYAQQNPSIFEPQMTYSGLPPGVSQAMTENTKSNYYGMSGDPVYTTPDPNSLYDDYVSNFDRGLGEVSAHMTLDDDMQALWDKQFTEGAYDNYSTEYMDTYNTLLDPYRQEQQDRFDQNMIDRGLPEGGDIYSDLYRAQIGDPNSRADTMAAAEAAQAAEAAMMNDYNILASAFGMSQAPVPYVDTMGPANMIMNADMMNTQSANQASSDFWNAGGLAAGGIFGGAQPWWMG